MLLALFALLALRVAAGGWHEDAFGIDLGADDRSLHAVLFASSTCDACVAFQPLLDKALDFSQVALVMVSRDHNVVRYQRHVASLPAHWHALPYESVHGELLNDHYNITALPSLIVLGEHGEVLDLQGYFTVLVLGKDAVPYWGALRAGTREWVDHKALHANGGAAARKGTLAKLVKPPDAHKEL